MRKISTKQNHKIGFRRTFSGVLAAVLAVGMFIYNNGFIGNINAADIPGVIVAPASPAVARLTGITVTTLTVGAKLEFPAGAAQISEFKAYAGEHGNNPEDPVEITSVDDVKALQWLCNYDASVNGFANKYIKLTTDLDLGGGHNLNWITATAGNNKTMTINGSVNNVWVPIGGSPNNGADCLPFRGHFDGNNKKISNVVVYKNHGDKDFQDSSAHAGFFGLVQEGSVKNLSITGNSIVLCRHIDNIASARAGAIAGMMCGANSEISGCTSNAKVVSIGKAENGYVSTAGGIVGYYSKDGDVTLQGCSSTGNVYSNMQAGGVCGAINGYTLASSLQTSSKIYGNLHKLTVSNCTRPTGAGEVIAVKYAGGIIGGLSYNTGVTIQGCDVAGYICGGEDGIYMENPNPYYPQTCDHNRTGALIPGLFACGGVNILNCHATNAGISVGGLVGGVTAMGTMNVKNCSNSANCFLEGAIISHGAYAEGDFTMENCAAETGGTFYKGGLIGTGISTCPCKRITFDLCQAHAKEHFGRGAIVGYGFGAWYSELHVKNCSATADTFYKGGLIGDGLGGIHNATMENCRVEGNEIQRGALVGFGFGAAGKIAIDNCSANVKIYHSGGLFGCGLGGEFLIRVTNCSVHGDALGAGNDARGWRCGSGALCEWGIGCYGMVEIISFHTSAKTYSLGGIIGDGIGAHGGVRLENCHLEADNLGAENFVTDVVRQVPGSLFGYGFGGGYDALKYIKDCSVRATNTCKGGIIACGTSGPVVVNNFHLTTSLLDNKMESNGYRSAATNAAMLGNGVGANKDVLILNSTMSAETVCACGMVGEGIGTDKNVRIENCHFKAKNIVNTRGYMGGAFIGRGVGIGNNNIGKFVIKDVTVYGDTLCGGLMGYGFGGRGDDVEITNVHVAGRSIGGYGLLGMGVCTESTRKITITDTTYTTNNDTKTVDITEAESNSYASPPYGGIAGVVGSDTTVTNCGVIDRCNYNGSRIGSFFGYANEVNFANCSTNANIQTIYNRNGNNVFAGGLAGGCDKLSAEHCTVDGTIKAENANTTYKAPVLVGGLAGYVGETTGKGVNVCYTEGSIDATTVENTEEHSAVGGLFGTIGGVANISNCYSRSNITRSNPCIFTAGIVRNLFSSSSAAGLVANISHVYATGTGAYDVGLVGNSLRTLNIKDSYYDIQQTPAPPYAGGNANITKDTKSGTRTTAQMQTTTPPLFDSTASEEWCYHNDDYPTFNFPGYSVTAEAKKHPSVPGGSDGEIEVDILKKAWCMLLPSEYTFQIANSSGEILNTHTPDIFYPVFGGLSAGTYTISVFEKGGSDVLCSCQVKLVDPPKPPEETQTENPIDSPTDSPTDNPTPTTPGEIVSVIPTKPTYVYLNSGVTPTAEVTADVPNELVGSAFPEDIVGNSLPRVEYISETSWIQDNFLWLLILVALASIGADRGVIILTERNKRKKEGKI